MSTKKKPKLTKEDAIRNYLRIHGESTLKMISIKSVIPKTVGRILLNMARANTALRRQVVRVKGSGQEEWAYRLPDQPMTLMSFTKAPTRKRNSVYAKKVNKFDEPDYAFYLRNLPHPLYIQEMLE